MGKLGWCDNCNVPILDGLNCGICQNESRPLNFTRTELKPIFPEEANLYRDILARKTPELSNILPDGLSFYNTMGEIVIDGQKVLRLLLDKEKHDWTIRLFKAFAATVPLFQGSNREKILAANEPMLRRKEEEALAFLERAIEKSSHLPLAVSFSGGKDSLVALALTS